MSGHSVWLHLDLAVLPEQPKGRRRHREGGRETLRDGADRRKGERATSDGRTEEEREISGRPDELRRGERDAQEARKGGEKREEDENLEATRKGSTNH